jgi:ribonuclease HI
VRADSQRIEPASVIIFTDGACSGNPGQGGYGVVLVDGLRRIELSGGFRLTTNNRMELMAAIVGLEALRLQSKVTICTDSKYVQEGIGRGWARSWRANGWRKKKGTRTNSDLWDRLLELCDHHDVEFVWLPGHCGNGENVGCDLVSSASGGTRQSACGLSLPTAKDARLGFAL